MVSSAAATESPTTVTRTGAAAVAAAAVVAAIPSASSTLRSRHFGLESMPSTVAAAVGDNALVTSPRARDGSLTTRVLAGIGLAALLGGGGLVVATALEREDVAGSPGPNVVTTTTEPDPVRPKVVLIKLTAVGTLDPEGDQRENDGDARLAVDGDPSTAWSTERYDSFFKQGVGLVLDAGAVRRLERLDLVSGTPGVTAEIRASTSPDGPFRTIAAVRALGEKTVFGLRGARGRYVVVWITGIPGGGSAQVAEVRLRARGA